jgi:hypothetical protein
MFHDRCHLGCDDPRSSLGKARTAAQSIAFPRRINRAEARDLLISDHRDGVIGAEAADEFVKAFAKHATSLFDLVFFGGTATMTALRSVPGAIATR